jgi:hypothetical protein
LLSESKTGGKLAVLVCRDTPVTISSSSTIPQAERRTYLTASRGLVLCIERASQPNLAR